MELLKLLLVCCACAARRAHGAALQAEEEFPAAAERLLRNIRMPAARTARVPAALSDLEQVLQPRFPGCKAEVFGSIATGVAISESDLDVYIALRNRTAATPPPAELVLQARDLMLQRPDLFQVIKTIPQAAYPIVTATHLPSGFCMDVSFNSYNGVLNSKLVRHLMNLDHRAKDLAQVLKHWGRVHNITGVTMLPSYGIVIMAVFFLQQREILPTVASLQENTAPIFVDNWNMGFTRDKYKTRNEDSLCEVLGGFFEYFNEFDYKKYIVSPYVGRPVEIELFKDLNMVPEQFELYSTNVRLNTTKPLPMAIPIVQDIFVHNYNVAYRINDLPKSILVTSAIQHAAEKFQEGCAGFLEEILAK